MTLFINCCPRGESRTEKLARALLKALGEYEELRLYDEPLHPLGRADIAKRDALLAEKKYDDEMFCYARQFAAADRIVIAAPLLGSVVSLRSSRCIWRISMSRAS